MANIDLAIVADFGIAEKLLAALEERSFGLNQVTAIELTPFGEEQSLRFKGKSVVQLPSDEVDWSQFGYVFFAGKMSDAELLSQAVQAGCIVLDLYAITALIGNVPVVVPSVNDEVLINLREHNIVALADPQICQLALSLMPLVNEPIEQIFVTSLLPSGYFGEEKVRALASQTAQLLNGIPLDEEKERVAFDCVPSNVQAEEKHLPYSKMFELQWAKVLPNLTACTFHSVQVPVFYGAAQLVTVNSGYAVDLEQLTAQWQNQPWLNVNLDKVITPVKNGENEEDNRLQISQLLAKDERSVQFWSVCDQQRFSLAFLAVALLERVINYFD